MCGVEEVVDLIIAACVGDHDVNRLGVGGESAVATSTQVVTSDRSVVLPVEIAIAICDANM